MKILNIGCGKDTFGTDFVDLNPLRDEVKRCDIDKKKLPFKDNTFGLVYSRNLLEHITNVQFAIGEMHRVLKKGGRVIIITDNASFFDYARGKVHLGGYKRRGIVDSHYLLFTEYHLRNIFRKCGFKVLSTSYLSGIIGWFNWLKPISSLLKLTPFWRMAYAQIRIEGVKI